MPDAQTTWKGYSIQDTKNWTDFKVIDFQPKEAGEYDIDVKIEFCGVCGSDVHTINGGWGEPMLPVIPGHEIAGTAIRVGPKVKGVKVGDRVGVGAQIDSCLDCKACNNDNENYCPKMVDTYNAKYENGDIAMGGYSTNIRAHERYVFPIPAEIPLEEAAPMFCAGLTVFSPLKRHGAGPGKTVGIVGVGGLGHFAVQFAKALGSDKVIVFSHSEKKKEDAKKLGADQFVLTENEEEMGKLAGEVDLIICTADVSKGLALDSLLSTLAVHGKFIMCGMPDDHFEIKSQLLSGNGCFIGGSHIGSKVEVLEMLEVAKSKGVRSWIQLLDMKDAGKAVKNVYDNNVRYRHVLKVDI